MPNYTASVAAATAVVGYNLFSDQVWSRSPMDRALDGIGLRGSAAAGDTEIEVYIDETRIGTFFNSSTGFANVDDLLPLERLGIPAGAELRAIVRDAPATNPINCMAAIEDL